MSSPIGPTPPRDPYKNYKVEPTQSEKQEREKFQESSPKNALGAQILLLFRRLFEFFEEPKEKGRSEIKSRLLLLKAALQTLKEEDQSQNISFLQRLSLIWRSLLSETSSAAISLKLNDFLKSVSDYPEGQEHTLGYYLFGLAEQKWIPFPFMEMIQKLHAEHQRNPSNSALETWTKEIDSLINVE